MKRLIFFEYEAKEALDWGYARNRRIVLMTPSAEWVQSVYSCPLDVRGKKLIVPNRDYPYEGLMVHQDGENWKFIDCVAVGLRRDDGSYVPLHVDPKSPVRVDPWQVTYSYIGFFKQYQVSFSVSYRLNSKTTPELATGYVEVSFTKSFPKECGHLDVVIQPFLDIRHMYENSNIDDYRIEHEPDSGRVHISAYNRMMTFYVPEGRLAMFADPDMYNWWYKMGTGYRTEYHYEEKNFTRFTGEGKEIAAYFNITSPLNHNSNSLKLYFGCGLGDASRRYSTQEIQQISAESTVADSNQLQEIERLVPSNTPYHDAIVGRIVGLTKFKIYIKAPGLNEHVKIPFAGAWWFKTPWFRDVFEGMLNSFETLMSLPVEANSIKDVVLVALRFQDKETGLIPNRVREYKQLETQYNASDATLLCFMAANAYLARNPDLGLASEVVRCAERTIRFFQERVQHVRVDGPPRVDEETGLLLSVPHHSWLDTRMRTVDYAGWKMTGLPNRASAYFVKDLYDLMGDQMQVTRSLSSPVFFLPEINAQWITMLKGFLNTIDIVLAAPSLAAWPELLRLRDDTQVLFYRATNHFKEIFRNPDTGFLYNIVHESKSVRDEFECEAAVVAAGMLGLDIFTREELASIFECTKKTLMVYRRPVEYGKDWIPFGLAATNEDSRIYYGDNEYHSDVVWLRSTPYLLKLLDLLNESETAKQILINTLDHQMTEGAIFYNQELFSKPCGNNPHPEKTSRNPVPVKNPIQFWSQWCDPMITFFSK